MTMSITSGKGRAELYLCCMACTLIIIIIIIIIINFISICALIINQARRIRLVT
jgi:hypothetical protein